MLRQSSTRWIKVLGCLIVAAGVCSPLSASADRRSSLQGNRLITDGDDVFIYPHLAYDYRNNVTLDYGLGAGIGSGLFLAESERGGAWGVALQRGTLFDVTRLTGPTEFDALASAPNPLLSAGSIGSADPATAFDLFMAGKSFGLRLSAGAGRDEFTNADAVVGMNRTRFMQVAMGFEAAKNWDVGLHLGGANASQREALTLTQRVIQARGTLIARGYFKRSSTRHIGVLFRTGYIFEQADDPRDSTSRVRVGDFDVGAGVGPRIKLADRVQVAAYGVVNYQNTTLTQSSGVQLSTRQILMPGFNIAAEASPRKWLRVRGGMEYQFTGASSDEDTQLEDFSSQLLWSGGVGFVRNDFDFNITLGTNVAPQVDLPDPVDPVDPMAPDDSDLLGDGLTGLLGAPTLMISATYRFGSSRDHSLSPTDLEEEAAERNAARRQRRPPSETRPPVQQSPPREGAATTLPPVEDSPSPEQGDEEEQKSSADPEENEENTSRKKDGGKMLGTPPPPGQNDLFVPAKQP